MSKKNKNENEDGTTDTTLSKTIDAISAERLSFRTIREGMKVFGCITAIKSTSLDITLPGRINGTVQVASISQAYVTMAKKFLENEIEESEYNTLADIFRIGQVVCAKVAKIDSASKVNVELSLQPHDIQADFKHNTVKKNMILSVAIAERQEHGYVIETGIKNLRGFLPAKTTGDAPDDAVSVGGVYFCRVAKITVTSSASTATFALASETEARVLRFTAVNVDHILPGCVAQFTVKKLLKDGLQGDIFDGSLSACINEHQLGFAESGNPRQLKDFKVDSVLKARILYIMPMSKIAYLSLNLQDQLDVNTTIKSETSNQRKIYSAGTLIEEAVVSHIRAGNIVIKLPKAKGVISVRSIKADIKANFDSEVVLSNYPKGSVHKVRVLHYDPIDSIHVCSVDKKIINEKHFSLGDVNTGDIVTAKVQIKLKDGRYAIRIGKIKGFIHPLYLSKKTPANKLEPNSLLRCRIVCKNPEKKELFVTNIKELMEGDSKILTAQSKLIIEEKHLGLVKRCMTDGWLIEFFDYMTGMIYRNQLTPSELSTAERFFDGQIVNVIIKSVRKDGDNKRISLGLSDFVTDIAAVHRGKITAIQPTGLDVAFLLANMIGFVPIMYLSDFPSLVHGLYHAYRCNDDIEAIGVAQNCYSIRDVNDNFGNPINVKTFGELNAGDIIPAYVKNVKGDVVQVYCFLKNIKTTFSIHLKMFVENYERASDITLVPDQKIFVKVLSKHSASKSLTLTAKLSDVWPGDFLQTANITKKYFQDVNEIAKRSQNDVAFNKIQVGKIVEGVPVEQTEYNSSGERVFSVNDSVEVIVTAKNFVSKKGAESRKILIVWKDYAKKLIYGTTIEKLLLRAETKHEEDQATQQLLDHPGFKANVLLTLDEVIVVYPTKWTNRFVYIPTRFHYNDFQPIVPKGVHEGSQMNVVLIGVKENHFIGMTHSLFTLYNKSPSLLEQMIKMEVESMEKPSIIDAEDIEIKDESDAEEDVNDEGDKSTEDVVMEPKKKTKSKKGLKRKANAVSIERIDSENGSPSKKKKTNKKQQKKAAKDESSKPVQLAKSNATDKKNSAKSPDAKKKKFSLKTIQLDGAMDMAESDSDSESSAEDTLPGVSSFWSTDLNTLNSAAVDKDQDSSDDDDSDSSPDVKRKASAKERFEAARNEEARIHAIERSMADGDFIPTNIDQFDRLVMGEPNDSRIWIQYMAFHVQATEIDRARTIAKKALTTIDMRENQERLNIWVALLNIELRYGNKDTFDDTLKEALLVNEPFKIHSICLKIFADCNRVQELNDLVLTITKKYRQLPESWLNAAQALFEVNLAEKAKSLLNKALPSLNEKDRKYLTYFKM